MIDYEGIFFSLIDIEDDIVIDGDYEVTKRASYIDPHFNRPPTDEEIGKFFIAEEYEEFSTGFFNEVFRRVRRTVLMVDHGEWIKIDSFLDMDDAIDLKNRLTISRIESSK